MDIIKGEVGVSGGDEYARWGSVGGGRGREGERGGGREREEGGGWGWVGAKDREGAQAIVGEAEEA